MAPAKAHIEAKGGRTTIPRAFTLMTPAKIIETCLTCHAKDFNRANIRRSEHTEHDIACTECHSNHHSTTPRFLLSKSQPEACYQCHADIRSQFDMPSRHRVNEGFIACTDCHNPHGGFTPTFSMGKTNKMLVQAHGNEQPCLNCHVDKRGPFIFEHQVGNVDGCITCHRPAWLHQREAAGAGYGCDSLYRVPHGHRRLRRTHRARHYGAPTLRRTAWWIRTTNVAPGAT